VLSIFHINPLISMTLPEDDVSLYGALGSLGLSALNSFNLGVSELDSSNLGLPELDSFHFGLSNRR
jgi:hypothetical protein